MVEIKRSWIEQKSIHKTEKCTILPFGKSKNLFILEEMIGSFQGSKVDYEDSNYYWTQEGVHVYIASSREFLEDLLSKIVQKRIEEGWKKAEYHPFYLSDFTGNPAALSDLIRKLNGQEYYLRYFIFNANIVDYLKN